MATTDILPFATGAGADVQSQAAYAGSAIQTSGFSIGIVDPAVFNKALRQAAFMAAGLAQLCVGEGVSVPDDGNLTNLTAELGQAIDALAVSAVGHIPTSAEIEALAVTAIGTIGSIGRLNTSPQIANNGSGAGIVLEPVATVSAAQSPAIIQNGQTYVLTANATFTLPTASSSPLGYNLGFVCRLGAATLVPDASASIAGGAVGASYTLPVGGSGVLVRDDTANWTLAYLTLPASGGVYINASTVLSVGATYLVDTSAGSFSATLPPSPSSGQTVTLQDVAGAFQANPLTLLRNGSLIQGAANNLTCNLNGTVMTLLFFNSSWRIT